MCVVGQCVLTMLYLCLLLTAVSAYSPPDNSGENMARTFGVLTAQVRDSFLYPLILNPLNVNKLTCGSVLTLYDNSSSDITVAADTVCLKGQVKIYLLITWARKHSKTLERWHFLH